MDAATEVAVERNGQKATAVSGISGFSASGTTVAGTVGRKRDTLPPSRPTPALVPWVRAQSVNLVRHAAALRPFQIDEFGTGAASPTDAHVQAANDLITMLRKELLRMTGVVRSAADAAIQKPSPAYLQEVVSQKDRAHHWVQAIEKIWDFYFELFGQRQSRYADWMLSCDRIALDCYRYSYVGLGVAKSLPAPPPFCYMRTGFSPATFRRGIPLRKLGKQINPFPLIQLPYHRLVNPWTLGAVLHEVSHNLQSDIGLNGAVPRAIARRLLQEGCSPSVAATWTRWNRETFADLSALLLGGPSTVASLMDVVGRKPSTVMGYDPNGVHPTPFLRTLISVELLRRMGFPEQAEHYRRAWMQIYPDPRAGNIPSAMLKDFPTVCALVVDTICYRPYQEMGDRSLAQVIRFEPKEQALIEEAAQRMASGSDPGIIPERFLIGAARTALDRRLARPGVIATNFYKELARR